MKTLQQVKERILALRSRERDGLDVSIAIGVLEEEIQPLAEDMLSTDPFGLKQVMLEIGSQYLLEEKYPEARICIWFLE